MCESDWVREGFVEDLIVESIEESIFFCSIEITTNKKNTLETKNKNNIINNKRKRKRKEEK